MSYILEIFWSYGQCFAMAKAVYDGGIVAMLALVPDRVPDGTLDYGRIAFAAADFKDLLTFTEKVAPYVAASDIPASLRYTPDPERDKRADRESE